MNPQKPGWQTSEFWVTLFTQLLSIFVVLGVVKPEDKGDLAASITSAVTAAFTLISAAMVVGSYIQGRVDLKSQHMEYQPEPINPEPPAEPPSSLPLKAAGFLLAALAVWSLGSTIQAAEPTVSKTEFLPWRARMAEQQRQLQKQPAPAPAPDHTGEYLALIGQLANRPAPESKLIIVYQPALPIGGNPLQQLPQAGPPLQQLPQAGPPLQVLPQQGAPIQQLPQQGQPIQQLPQAGAPLQVTPGVPQQQLQPVAPSPATPALPPSGSPGQRLPTGPQPQRVVPALYR